MLRAPSRLGRWFWGAGLLCVLGTCARGHLPGAWHRVHDWLGVPVFLQGGFSPRRQEIRRFQVTVLDANGGSSGHGAGSRRDAPLGLGGQERRAGERCVWEVLGGKEGSVGEDWRQQSHAEGPGARSALWPELGVSRPWRAQFQSYLTAGNGPRGGSRLCSRRFFTEPCRPRCPRDPMAALG